MMFSAHITVAFVVIFKLISGQRFVGDTCTFKATGAAGVCKLLSECQPAREDLQKNNRFPQTCGFEGTQPTVCCLENEATSSQRKPGDISIKQCREYAKIVYDRKISPVDALINSTTVVRNECGHNVVQLEGQQARRKEFPHMAAIGYEPTPGEIRWLCGGTIISNEYILTAGHCLSDNAQGDAKYVRLGVSALNDTIHRQDIAVAERILHPEYRTSSLYHDIGLLKLKEPIKLTPYARPACLYLQKNVTTEKAIATGWDTTSWGGEGSNDLLKVTLNLFDHNICNSSYKNQIGRKLSRGIDDDIQLCAGWEEKYTCQRDSGGPLQIYHIGDDIKCMYDIIGISSFGKACSGIPGVYVRVSSYIKWIEDIVWPQ